MPVTTCAAMRLGSVVTTAAAGEVLEPVRADHREEGGAERDEHVRAQSGRLLVELALEADRRAEAGGDGEAEQDVQPVERGDLSYEAHRPPAAVPL